MQPLVPVYIMHPRFEVNYDSMISSVMQQNQNTSLAKGVHNFSIVDNDASDFDKLYGDFLDVCFGIFPNMQISPLNSRQTSAYVISKDHYHSVTHNHINTAVINGVFYLSTTHSTDYRDGSISFYLDDRTTEIFCYRPRQGDLIIFPGDLYHNINPTQGSGVRISINLEIQCHDVWRSPPTSTQYS